MMVMLGATCTRPANLVEGELYERFSSGSDHWEFLLTTDAQIGSDPPSSPHANPAGDWHPLDELGEQDFRSLAGLWVRTVLPSSVQDDPHLLISGSAGTFAIYVDDALIYRHGDFRIDHPVLEPHSRYHIIPIPPGFTAALIASMVKIAFESQTPVASDPAKVLSGMNQTFCGNLQDQFITAGYLFLDISKSEMIYAGAGHPPLLLQRTSTGEIRECGENGLLFAGFEHAEYSNDRKALQPGDRLVFFTDGIIEANNIREEQFGMTRLRDFMTDNSSLGAAEFADALIGHLSKWSGRNSMDDDLTLVVMDFTGP